MADESTTRKRSRSRSPAAPRDRDNTRGRRDGDSHPRKPRSGGFGWKDKSRNSTSYADERGDRRGGLERGYRSRRSPSPRRRRDGDNDRDQFQGSASSGRRERERDSGHSRGSNRDRDRRDRDRDDRPPRRDKSKKSATPAAPTSGEEMIIVHVNDRLGTKAAIPCFASDRVKEFKILVAARIGREPHEILLKRQGERPFKDQLSLEDYGVSNGVQIDLEVDTGD
ncbi:hypothetical protein Cpir12675_001176 [Ceratocystis pirilliformis]|uniref:Ubiquitin-like modifier HUB1 n=1 Tax=Ceratocystis pirilliformis TaxID=259994 RepID=A0ABR3ZIS3_9PEZI